MAIRRLGGDTVVRTRRTALSAGIAAVLLLTGCSLGPGDVDERGGRPGPRTEPVEPRRSERARIATLNVLGASHTGPEGDSKPEWPSYEARLGGMVEALESNRVTLAGLQELQKPQWRAFREQYGDRWGLFPRTDDVITANSVIWRRSGWRLISARQFDIPYFGGDPQAQSRVTLERRSTGEVVHVVNVHNPADVRGDNRRFRRQALRVERRLVRRLGATGDPVYLMGDFNEIRAPHCVMTRAGLSNGFGDGRTSPCRPPARAGIDMVFSLNVPARRARVDESVMTNRYADHPLVTLPLG